MDDSNFSGEYSIGICATGHSENIRNLIESIERDDLSKEFYLNKIVIVASDCTPDSLKLCKMFASKDTRIVLIEEKSRNGKAQAINRIISETHGKYLLMVNSDAVPSAGSINRLLKMICKEESIGMVSGCPTFGYRNGATSEILQLMWKLHNQSSLILNHKQLSNHCSDELMVIRRTALNQLPNGVVNDGAFMASMAAQRGYSIKFCESASVNIDVPKRFVDLILQRRRIMFGHMQVKKLTGRAPITIESLLFIAPMLGLGVTVTILARFPRLLKVLPIAIVGEATSFLLALADSLRSSDRHAVWKRYAD